MSAKPVAAVLAVVAALASGVAHSQAPAPYDATPALIAAAQKEGKVVWYSATDVQVAEKLARAFEAKYPGIKVQVERSGAERIFQRLNQEYGSKIHNADVVETSDAVHFIYFKKQGWLQPAVPSDVAKHWPKDERDPDGQFAVYRAHLSVIAYNTKLIPKEQAPKSHADLLDPKWSGKMVKAHPGYSGTAVAVAPGLEVLRAARQAEGDAGAVLHRAAEEAGRRRAPRHGRRQRVQRVPAQGKRRADRAGVRPRRHPAGRGQCGAAEERAQPQRGAAVLPLHVHPRGAATQQRRRRPALLPPRGEGKGREKAGRTPLSQIKLLHSDPAKLDPDTIKKKYEEYFGT
ncbi:MAG: putative type Fe3+ transport system, periplasmic component [Ramlibacter sp.]|nr:putative type Fe3+ transport system, periplasmic component [Ramlibacter sp.]